VATPVLAAFGDDVRGAEFTGQRLPVGVPGHGDDTVRAENAVDVGGVEEVDTEIEGRTDDVVGVVQASREWGLQPYQVSLAWLLSRPAVASVIVGAESVDELTGNASAADIVLEPAQLDYLTAQTVEAPTM
jgi:aryl-alcohol dehydrogenase-like predicted oxidoreductase